jgi:RNA polymerase sigma-70 factor, ECF subfamily
MHNAGGDIVGAVGSKSAMPPPVLAHSVTGPVPAEGEFGGNEEEQGTDLVDVSSIVRAAAEGGSDAWRALIGLYARRVYALCKSRCKDHDAAEEITQSVFATIAVKISGGEYGEEGKFESWMFRIASNRVRDYIRRLKHRPIAQDPEVMDASNASAARGTAGVDDSEAALERTHRLRRAMEQLTESDREVVELRHHAGLSFKQIAEMLDEPLGTLLARHHRALKKMKELMGEWERSGVHGGRA